MRSSDPSDGKALPERGGRPWEKLVDTLNSAIEAIVLLDPEQLTPPELLALYDRVRNSRDRLVSAASTVLAHIDSTRATTKVAGVSTGTWLAQQHGTSGWRAQRELRFAGQLQRHEQVRQAVCSGRISGEQASAITRTLSRLPDQFSNAQREQAENYLVHQVGNLSPTQITCMVDDVIEQVDPANARQHAAERSVRERNHALRDRYTVLRRDGKGMTHIRAGVPDIEGARIQKVLDALGADTHHRTVDSSDAYLSEGTLSQRRTDALMLAFETLHVDMNMGPRAASGNQGAQQRWIRPRTRTQLRLAVTLDQLREAASSLEALEGHIVSPEDLRRLACDAEILPAVMGGPSELLDLGRTTRTVPPHLRDALAYRDRGCAFPGCDVTEPYCEAHHIVPWQEGGSTSLGNLVLLCSHHHGMIEPPPGTAGQPAAHQWRPRVAEDGVAEFLTPLTHPQPGQPRRHTRFRNLPLRD